MNNIYLEGMKKGKYPLFHHQTLLCSDKIKFYELNQLNY